jgi:hypothetical protein
MSGIKRAVEASTEQANAVAAGTGTAPTTVAGGTSQSTQECQILGDVAAAGGRLTAQCRRCAHRADLDLAALITRFGAGRRVLSLRGRCRNCGSTEVAIRPGAPAGSVKGATSHHELWSDPSFITPPF